MKLKRYLPVFLAAVMIACGTAFTEDVKKEFPYVAQIIGQNVNTRAGAGVNHYRCGRLSEPATVVVVDEQFGFAKIRPPKDSFSWVAIQYVDKKDETSGEINASNVRIWAGSPYVSAIHSSSSQVELNKGDKVTFTGKPEGDYYKILPPEGAYLWINAAYLKYLGPLSKFTPEGAQLNTQPAAAPVAAPAQTAPLTPVIDPANAPVVPVQTPAPNPEGVKSVIEAMESSVAEGQNIKLDKPLSDTAMAEGTAPAASEAPAVEPVKPAVRTKEAVAIEKYLELAKLVQAEKAKPLAVQNYDAMKTTLKEIVADPESGRAIKFSEVLLEIIERYETAQLADKSLRDQDSSLVKLRTDIKTELKKTLEEINATSGFVMIGTLARSYVYTSANGTLRYALKNDADQIIAYAVPVDAALYTKAEALIGKKVGLNGKVVPDENTAKVVVNFLDIKEIWDTNSR